MWDRMGFSVAVVRGCAWSDVEQPSEGGRCQETKPNSHEKIGLTTLSESQAHLCLTPHFLSGHRETAGKQESRGVAQLASPGPPPPSSPCY